MSSEKDLWGSLPMLTKLASVFFVLGKMVGFMTFFTFFINLQLAKWMLIGYATFIGVSILSSTCQMFKAGREEKPTKEQVTQWAREYNLLEGK